MAQVQTSGEKTLNRLAIVAVLIITMIFLAPIYWIVATSFKPRNLSTTIPPTVIFTPEISPFVKLFTKRSQLREQPTPEEYAAFIKKEQERWSKVVRTANIKAD